LCKVCVVSVNKENWYIPRYNCRNPGKSARSLLHCLLVEIRLVGICLGTMKGQWLLGAGGWDLLSSVPKLVSPFFFLGGFYKLLLV
jgi:hypothetical protein